MSPYRILAINPGSTSTKIAIFDDEKPLFEEVLRHSSETIASFDSIFDQYLFRKEAILETLNQKDINITRLAAVVGRGGLLHPMPGGTYTVNQQMLEDLKKGIQGQHASNLGGVLAYEIAAQLNIPSFIVDPVVVDELAPQARYSGVPEMPRRSIFHALNQKAVGRRGAKDLGMAYDKCRLIIAHLGGGISVGAHDQGKAVDVNNALDGDGPFSPERAGGIPAGELIRGCYSGKYTQQEMTRKLVGQGGLVAYLNTNDGREVVSRIQQGDKEAESVYRAMAYQIAKEIGSCAVVLKGKIDAIVLTGGLAYDELLTGWIREQVDFLGRVMVYPGEDEMIALTEGALRILRGEEKARTYAPGKES